jgi:hypothetical protein
MVPSSYISHKGDYITNADWRKAWAEALSVDYLPEVHNTAIRPPLKEDMPRILNYIAKNPQSPAIQDPSWIIALAEQIYHQRLIASGGSLKNLVHSGGRGHQTEQNINNITRFHWNNLGSNYYILDNIYNNSHTQIS